MFDASTPVRASSSEKSPYLNRETLPLFFPLNEAYLAQNSRSRPIVERDDFRICEGNVARLRVLVCSINIKGRLEWVALLVPLQTRPWIGPRSRHCSQTIRQICNFDFSQFITRRVSLYRNQPSTVATHVTQTTLSSRISRPTPNKHHPSWLPRSTRCATTVLKSPEILLLTRIAPQIKQIEDEMAKTQKNKATSYHLGTYNHVARQRKS